MLDVQHLHFRAHGIRESQGTLGIRVRQDRHELFAAVACDQVARPAQDARQRSRNQDQAFIAALVAVVVVVGLEVIDVDHDERQRRCAALGAPDLAIHVHIETAPVRNPGQAIRENLRLQLQRLFVQLLLARDRHADVGELNQAMARQGRHLDRHHLQCLLDARVAGKIIGVGIEREGRLVQGLRNQGSEIVMQRVLDRAVRAAIRHFRKDLDKGLAEYGLGRPMRMLFHPCVP